MVRSGLNLLALLAWPRWWAGAKSTRNPSGPTDRSIERCVLTARSTSTCSSRSGRIRVAVGASDTVHIVGQIRAYGSLTWWHMYSPSEQVKMLETTPPIDQSGNRITIGHISDDALASNVTISYDVTVPGQHAFAYRKPLGRPGNRWDSGSGDSLQPIRKHSHQKRAWRSRRRHPFGSRGAPRSKEQRARRQQKRPGNFGRTAAHVDGRHPIGRCRGGIAARRRCRGQRRQPIRFGG